MTALETGVRVRDVEVRPIEGLVDGPQGRVRIEPKAMAVLVELARRAGRVCSRDELQQKVWPRASRPTTY